MKKIAIFLVASTALFGAERPGELLVRMRPPIGPISQDNTHAQAHAQVIQKFSVVNGLVLVKVEKGFSTASALEVYAASDDVLYAEPNYIYTANDSYFSAQWGLHNSGQDGGTQDIDINAPEAWALPIGNTHPVIGIIDTGVDVNHPDLTNNLWKNPGEIPGNKLDDDRNGYIDDVHGINAITKTGNPMDDAGHGTHVAGIIGANGNKVLGISGVMPKARIISCKFLDAAGSGDVADAILCLDYFANLHERQIAKIVATNNSWGGDGFSRALYDAVKAHQKAGILFIAAAGNASLNHDEFAAYPASFDLANVISVAAIDRSGRLADFSDFGRYSIHVAAPGVEILSTIIGSYGNMRGTSMAAPHVTGLAALLNAQDPSRDWESIRNLILSAGKTLPSLVNTTLTGKLIRGADVDGMGSLTCVNQLLDTHILPHGEALSVPLGQAIPLSAYHINCATSLGDRGIRIDGRNQTLTATNGIARSELTALPVGLHTINFSENDRVSIDVFDATKWKSYASATIVPFQYRTIAGIPLPTGDETKATVVSPFDVPFGSVQSGNYQLYISSNGALSMTDNILAAFLHTSIPVTDRMTLVAPFWDDLFPHDQDSGIYHDVIGTAPHRELVIEWRNMERYNQTNENITFQVVFFEDRSDILFNYLKVPTDARPTIGVQVKPTLSLQYDRPIQSGLSLRFHEIGPSIL